MNKQPLSPDEKRKIDKIYDGYDLTNEMDRKEIEQFGNTLDTLKALEKLTRPLEYYGKVVDESKGLVNNPIISFAHWTEVQYAIDNKLIGKYPGGSWFVAYDFDASLSKNLDKANEFALFEQKRRALEYMRASKKRKEKEDSKLDEITEL